MNKKELTKAIEKLNRRVDKLEASNECMKFLISNPDGVDVKAFCNFKSYSSYAYTVLNGSVTTDNCPFCYNIVVSAYDINIGCICNHKQLIESRSGELSVISYTYDKDTFEFSMTFKHKPYGDISPTYYKYSLKLYGEGNKSLYMIKNTDEVLIPTLESNGTVVL